MTWIMSMSLLWYKYDLEIIPLVTKSGNNWQKIMPHGEKFCAVVLCHLKSQMRPTNKIKNIDIKNTFTATNKHDGLPLWLVMLINISRISFENGDSTKTCLVAFINNWHPSISTPSSRTERILFAGALPY